MYQCSDYRIDFAVQINHVAAFPKNLCDFVSLRETSYSFGLIFLPLISLIYADQCFICY